MDSITLETSANTVGQVNITQELISVSLAPVVLLVFKLAGEICWLVALGMETFYAVLVQWEQVINWCV